MRGAFICFEGGEGSGKTTAADSVVSYLQGFGIPAEAVADPGSTPLAQECRRILLDKFVACDPYQQLLLFMTARRALAVEITEKLAKGVTVVAGRWVWSTLSYQGTQGVPTDLIKLMHERIVQLDPDQYILLDVTPSVGLARKDNANRKADELPTHADRFESMDLSWHDSVRDSYLNLAARGKWPIIHTDRFDIQATNAEINKIMQNNPFTERLLRAARENSS